MLQLSAKSNGLWDRNKSVFLVYAHAKNHSTDLSLYLVTLVWWNVRSELMLTCYSNITKCWINSLHSSVRGQHETNRVSPSMWRMCNHVSVITGIFFFFLSNKDYESVKKQRHCSHFPLLHCIAMDVIGTFCQCNIVMMFPDPNSVYKLFLTKQKVCRFAPSLVIWIKIWSGGFSVQPRMWTMVGSRRGLFDEVATHPGVYPAFTCIRSSKGKSS